MLKNRFSFAGGFLLRVGENLMSLQNTLVTKLKNIEPREVLRKMGYRKITDKTIERLKRVLSNELLGLDKSHFDFKYSNLEFVKALCDLCEINFKSYQDDIDKQLEDISTLNHAYWPHVFVDTGFRRESQPIFALALLEGHRRLCLPIEYKLASLEEQVKYTKTLISEHYKNTEGHLDVWGDIKRYVLKTSETSSLVFNPQGDLIDEKVVDQNIAKVSLGSKDITKLLNN